ncbi:type II toxin-antitoxin system HicB family antitoxin [Rhodoglobus sp.]
MNISRAEHYTYRVRWSPEDEAFVGTVAEMPSLSWVDDLSEGAFAGIRDLAQSVIDDMLETGEIPPPAIADRTYSGKFMVRVTPESHRQLVIEAAEQNVSLNRLAASRLVS